MDSILYYWWTRSRLPNRPIQHSPSRRCEGSSPYRKVQPGAAWCICHGSSLGDTSSLLSCLIPIWTQPTTRPICNQDDVACHLLLDLKYSCTTDKEGQKICMYEEIFGKNGQHRWGTYVHVAFYFTLDCNRMDTCMHSRNNNACHAFALTCWPRKRKSQRRGPKF